MIAMKQIVNGEPVFTLQFSGPQQTEEISQLLTGLTYMVVDGNPALGELLMLATTVATLKDVKEMLDIYQKKRPQSKCMIPGNMILAIKAAVETH